MIETKEIITIVQNIKSIATGKDNRKLILTKEETQELYKYIKYLRELDVIKTSTINQILILLEKYQNDLDKEVGRI